jgi:hypothetical protein
MKVNRGNSSNITTSANDGPNVPSPTNEKVVTGPADTKPVRNEPNDQNGDQSEIATSNNFEDSKYEEEFFEMGLNPSKYKHYTDE